MAIESLQELRNKKLNILASPATTAVAPRECNATVPEIPLRFHWSSYGISRDVTIRMQHWLSFQDLRVFYIEKVFLDHGEPSSLIQKSQRLASLLRQVQRTDQEEPSLYRFPIRSPAILAAATSIPSRQRVKGERKNHSPRISGMQICAARKLEVSINWMQNLQCLF